MVRDKHVKYGGIKFSSNVPPEEINDFVRNLPEEKRNSLFEVVKKLEDEGLITLEDGDLSTIDEEELQYYTVHDAYEKGERC